MNCAYKLFSNILTLNAPDTLNKFVS